MLRDFEQWQAARRGISGVVHNTVSDAMDATLRCATWFPRETGGYCDSPRGPGRRCFAVLCAPEPSHPALCASTAVVSLEGVILNFTTHVLQGGWHVCHVHVII